MNSIAFDANIAAQLQPELELLRPLGSGETAIVYLAREPALQRLVALKVMRLELAADAVARQRFEREAQSAARITHPNVTSIYRIGRLADDVPYIVMEYIDGRTVRDIVDAGTTLDVSYARRLLAAVASALASAHDRGIIHRDVRPANVFVENRTARAVLGDFGIAALLESGAASGARLTAAGTRLGDTRYLSPEQVRGEQITEQSDVYAFGILAYEALTGRGPYTAGTESQLLAAHLEAEPLPLRELRRNVDAATAHLIERCLAKDANRRPRAVDLAAALSNTATAAAILPEDRGPLAELLGELRRRRVYRVLAGYGAFGLAVLGVAQGVDQAFPMSRTANQAVLLGILAGLPITLMLAWVYDIRAGRILRTHSRSSSSRSRALMWTVFAAVVLIALVLGSLVLRGD